MTDVAPGFTIREEAFGKVLEAFGDWTVRTIGDMDAALGALHEAPGGAPIVVDVTRIGRIDTSGAMALDRSGDGVPVQVIGEHPVAGRLILEVERHREGCAPPPPPVSAWRHLLSQIGRSVVDLWREVIETLSFVGQTQVTVLRLLARPHRIRWTAVVSVMESAGLNALPIVMTLSFFIGAVVAYMGANILAQFGAQLFTVELVAIAVLREFGVLITAIMLAGRSDSAFTAQIGSMKLGQEVDAMRVIGLDPVEVLVAPRVIALLVVTPILTFASMMTGILGGALVSWSSLGISPTMFLGRMQDVVPLIHFWAGMMKAPVFAFIIAVIGCRQGLNVQKDVESLGRCTTSSVVQAIFLVIVVDAVFAMMYLELNI
jgi:phospholipid/cholesterol/gamma-HCH transport system permease protein